MKISSPKVVLINPPSTCVEDDRVEPPLGLLYIAATISKLDIEISVHDLAGCKSIHEIQYKIQNIPEADIYGIGCLCTNYNYAKKIIQTIRQKQPYAYIVMGGPNPSAIPEFTLNDSKCDVVATGEGEDVFFSIVKAFIDGVRLRGIIKGIGRQDIDSYMFPARHLVDISTYSRRLMGLPVISLISSRGCIHNCIYCNSIVMGGGNKTPRYRSPENVIEEIKKIRGYFQHFRFNDDYFTGNPDLESLLIGLRDLNIRYRIFARVEDLNENNCRMLEQSGCVHITVGLESLDPDNLRIIGKRNQIGKERNIMIAKEYGMIIRTSFIVGLPHDSDISIESCFRKAACLGIDEFAIYPLIPYPGTPIAQNPEKFGYQITDNDFSHYIQIGKNRETCYALKHKNFDSYDVKRWLNMASQLLSSGGAKHISDTNTAT